MYKQIIDANCVKFFQEDCAMKWLLAGGLLLWAGCGKVPAPIEPEIKERTGNRYQTEQLPPTVQNEPFNIDFKFTHEFNLAFANWSQDDQLKIMGGLTFAQRRWEQVIVEGLPDVYDGTPGYNLGHVDDVVVSVSWNPRDEVNQLGQYTVGAARPVIVRTDSLELPYYGSLRLYPVLLDTSYTVHDCTEIVTHELGHILGFSEYHFSLIGTEMVNGVRYFNGTNAAEGYKLLLYYIQQEKLAYAIPGIRVPLQNDSPHWRFPSLMWEIMGPNMFAGQTYFTIITMLAMKDLGYIVDTSTAEVPPPGLTTKPAVDHTFQHSHETHIIKGSY